MNCTATYIPYRFTKRFSNLVLDYIEADTSLAPFYNYAVNEDGIKKAIANKTSFSNRKILCEQLQKQYSSLPVHETVEKNIENLQQQNTFTICTAHQPNIFTGPLYFIYKIAHAIQLARTLNAKFPDNNFVPVYYMGSEDADLDELGNINSAGKKYEWKTDQKGAVGRMLVDKKLIQLINELEAQWKVEKFGDEIISIFRNAYREGTTIEAATFHLVNELFGKYGLVIVLPDNAELKRLFAGVIEKELFRQFSHEEVEKTINAFPEKYKVQAAGRELNLFYLENNIRERIIKEGEHFTIANTSLIFTETEMHSMLKEHPERFSPNVILRPVFQETILPNIAFIGGGGEIAYWLELKNVFDAVNGPLPMLVLRNSFLIITQKQNNILEKLKIKVEDMFQPSNHILRDLISSESSLQLDLKKEMDELKSMYQSLKEKASAIDVTLATHTEALHHIASQKINKLEKKMFSAEKKKFEATERQFNKIYQQLFPSSGLQERVFNLVEYYAVYGESFIENIIQHSLHLQQEFCILTEE